ncbi:MAG: hypothetical protein GXC72_03145 [Chitinophagaceae bacterium]|nr:hypothetical protein [Chitinophagaceae bacterium]
MIIRKTILVTILLLLGYAALVRYCFRDTTVAQHQWQGNLIKARNYALGISDTNRTVMLGSSLSYRFQPNDLPGITNLSMAGMGIFDGLALVAKSKHRPDTLLIEMNLLLRPPDAGFMDLVYQPYAFYTGKYIPMLREGKQPAGILTDQLSKWALGGKKKTSTDAAVAENAFQQVLELQKQNFAKAPATDSLQQTLHLLKTKLQTLEQSGCRIIFYEMPINPVLMHSPFANALREGFLQTFPAGQYHYIFPPENLRFHTTDGIHLSRGEVLQYVKVFRF